jgi:hypothetical protein
MNAVFKLPKVESQEIIYYGEDKENNCADVFYKNADRLFPEHWIEDCTFFIKK